MVDASFSVTPNGSASYIVPIQVPPGTNGVQPRLTVAYDSQASNGVLGMGFSLHGLSSITRCAATKALDGYVGSINFNAQDRFCLDGRRLILVEGSTYGAPGTVYHTEIETWTKITAGEACGSGPCSFMAIAKDGTTLEFGVSPDSRVPVPGISEIFSWSIGRSIDLNHNTVEVAYRQDSAEGQIYPQTISYTGNTATGLLPQRTVTFEWQARPDVVPKYVGGFLTELGNRLAKVSTQVGGEAVLEYRFSYETSAGTGRSRLHQIDLCAPDPEQSGDFLCFEPTVLTWQDEDNSLTAASGNPDGLLIESWCSRSGDNLSGWADFDGDGLDDLTCAAADGSQYVLLSTGSGLESPNGDPDGLVAEDWCPFSDATVRWGDFDGDGKADLHCDSRSGSHWVLISDGTGVSSPNEDPSGLVVDNWCPSSIGRSHWINFDGDGRVDLTCAGDDGSHYVLVSNGAGLTSPNDDRDGLILENWCASAAPSTFWGDFNGDGMSDLNCSLTDGSHYVQLSTGTGVTSPNDSSDGLIVENWCPGTSTDRRFSTTDLNGDRLFDLACHTKSGSQYVLLSTGTGVVSPNNSSDGLLLENWCGGTSSFVAWNDFNGDGLQDLGCSFVDNGNQYVQLSTGTVLRPPSSDPDGLLTQSWCPGAGVERIDFNGDALGDLHCPASDGSQYVLLHTAGFPDLLASLENGFGGTFDLTYKPLTDPSVYSRSSTPSTYPILDVVSPLYVLSSYVKGDGRGASYGFDYTYTGAKNDLERRLWLGFHEQIMTGRADGQLVTTTFSQAYPQNGFVLANVAETAAGAILATTNQAAVVISPYSNVHQVVPDNKTDVTYQNGLRAQTRQVQYQYDAYGNLELTADLGDPAITTDDVFTCVRHDNDTTAWQLGYELERRLTTTRSSCQAFLDATTATWSADSLRWTKLEYDDRRNPKTMKVYDLWPEEESEGTWATFEREFDDWGNVVSIVDPSRQSSILEYDDTYKTFLTSRQTPELAGDLVLTTSFTYEPHFGLLVSTVDPNGNESAWQKDPFGRIVASLGPSPSSSSRAATELLTTTTFHSEGGVHYDEVRVRQTWDDSDPTTWFWQRTYLDGMSRVYQTTSRGPSSAIQRMESFQYDAEGRLWKSSYPYYLGETDPGDTDSGDTPAYNLTEYDEHGRISLITAPDGSKVKTEYDTAQNRITTIEGYGTPNARSTVSTLDSRGNVLTLEMPNGGVTNTQYSRLSQRLIQTNPVGAETTWQYDTLGRVRVVSDADSGDRTYTYDDEGFLRSATDGVGNLVEMVTYDAIGRLVERKVTAAANGAVEQTTYTYDQSQYTNPLGRMTRVSSSSSLQEFAYDRYGNVSAQSLTLDGDRYTEALAYDPAGRLAALTYPDGSVLHRGYDDQGYLQSLDLEPASGGALKNYAGYTGYDAMGQAGTAVFGSGITSTYSYYPITQALGRPETATISRGESTLSTRTYGWNGFGQLETVDVSPTSSLSESFTYHPGGWLHTAQGPYAQQAYTYDPAGNLKTVNGVTYSYPEASDQLSSTTDGSVFGHDDNGNVDSRSAGEIDTIYTYDGSSNLVGVTQNGSVVMQAVYDPEGHRLKRTDADGTVSRYLFGTYDRVDQGGATRYTKYVVGDRGPVAAITVEASSAQAAQRLRYQGHRMATRLYDPTTSAGLWAAGREHLAALVEHPGLVRGLGQGLTAALGLVCLLLALSGFRRRWVDSGAGSWGTDFGRRHRVFADATPWVLAALLLGLAPPVHAELGDGGGIPEPGELYFLVNHVESTVQVTDGQGNPRSQVTYEPFGEIDSANSSGPDDFRPKFTTKELDSGTGLYYFGARYQDPQLGRFLQPDVERQFPSPYAYVGNDPEDGVDPDGNFALLITAVVIGVGVLMGAYFGAAAVNHSYNPTHWNWRSGKTYAGLFAGAAIGAVGATLGAVAAEAGVAAGIVGEILIGAGENAAYTALGGGSAKDIAMSALQGAALSGLTAVGGRAISSGVGKLSRKLNLRGKLSELGTKVKRGARQLLSACSSFPAGVPVATEDGPRPIEEVEVGDRVWSVDLDTGELRLNPVTELLDRRSDSLLRIETNGEPLRITGEHPVYVSALGWVPASRLQPGDPLVTLDGDPLTVTGIEEGAGVVPVYNLEVDRDHNYLAGLDEVLVHNGKPSVCRAPSVPTVRQGKFSKWFDSMDSKTFSSHWNHPSYGVQFKKTIKRRLRRPGRMHEWVMVSRAEKARVWGLTYQFFADETRSKIGTFNFLEKASGNTATHGTNSISSRAHIEIGKLIDEASTFRQYKIRLRKWANGKLPGSQYALEGGSANLPQGFQ